MAKFICENCKKEYVRKGNLDRHALKCKSWVILKEPQALELQVYSSSSLCLDVTDTLSATKNAE